MFGLRKHAGLSPVTAASLPIRAPQSKTVGPWSWSAGPNRGTMRFGTEGADTMSLLRPDPTFYPSARQPCSRHLRNRHTWR